MIKEDWIVWLQDDESNFESFGFKTKQLNLALKNGIRVPQGFSISSKAVKEISILEKSKKLLLLKQFYDSLLLETENQKLIVRSSSTFEGIEGSQFSGLFRSMSNIESFEDLTEAIKLCHSSSIDKSLSTYFLKSGLDICSLHLSILIQHQIDCDFSGVINISNGIFFGEFTKGNLDNVIKGLHHPLFTLRLQDPEKEYNVLGDIYLFQKFEAIGVLPDLKALAKKIAIVFGNNIAIEIGIKNSKLYVFQIKFGVSPSIIDRYINVTGYNRKNKSVFFEENNLGLKGAALKYFVNKRLFSKPLFLFPPESTIDSIRKRIETISLSDFPMTVRFSHKNNIGLPRIFVSEPKEIIKEIDLNRKSHWTTIIHTYLNIVSSYEIQLSEKQTIVEHVPGMWESDNRLPPDVIIINKKNIKFYLYQKNRRAKLYNDIDSFVFIDTKPVCLDTALEWSMKVENIVNDLRRDFKDNLPLNIHFCQERDQSWQFLNIREGFNLTSVETTPPEWHVVKELDDLAKWNDSRPILLQLATERGKEGQLIAIARKLQNIKTEIYIDFGILSHPAMVLREFGLVLIPAYLNKKYHKNDYEAIELDNSYDPKIKILNEKPIYQSSDFIFVLDKEPICDKHILLISKQTIESLADFKDIELVQDNINSFIFHEDFKKYNWIMFERGRASFCSSSFPRKCAHSHFLPFWCFETDLVESLTSLSQFQHFENIVDALQIAAKSKKEYLLFGNNEVGFYLEIPSRLVSEHKRFIRTFLIKHKKED